MSDFVYLNMTGSENILKEIKRIVKSKAPNAKVYLFGSRVKGNARNDSDWDLLILLNRDKITVDIEKEISDPLYDLEFNTGEVISPKIFTEKEWNTKYKITPFYYNVMKEGKLL